MDLRVIPYLIMDGNAAEAIAFYETALGAQVVYRQPPAESTTVAAQRVTHATLRIGQSTVMVRDKDPDQHRIAGNQMALAIATTDEALAQRMFASLQQGGRVEMPLRETSFSPAHGMVIDKFGVVFQITAQPPKEH